MEQVVLDTNIVLYHLGGRLAEPLPDRPYAVSAITEIELLSQPEMPPAEEQVIREFLRQVELIEIDAPVRAAAIELRRTSRLKLPDAIIAATAIHLGAELWSNDVRMGAVSLLRCRPLRLT